MAADGERRKDVQQNADVYLKGNLQREFTIKVLDAGIYLNLKRSNSR